MRRTFVTVSACFEPHIADSGDIRGRIEWPVHEPFAMIYKVTTTSKILVLNPALPEPHLALPNQPASRAARGAGCFFTQAVYSKTYGRVLMYGGQGFSDWQTPSVNVTRETSVLSDFWCVHAVGYIECMVGSA